MLNQVEQQMGSFTIKVANLDSGFQLTFWLKLGGMDASNKSSNVNPLRPPYFSLSPAVNFVSLTMPTLRYFTKPQQMRTYIICALLLVSLPSARMTNADIEASEHIRRMIEASDTMQQPILIENQEIISRTLLPDFYRRAGFERVWMNAQDVYQLTEALSRTGAEGLNPTDYHLSLIESYHDTGRQNPVERAQLDLLLTDAYLLCASHLLSGKVNPETLTAEWKAYRREGDLVQSLLDALRDHNVSKSLESLLPEYDGYERLKQVLANYEKIRSKGGWQHIPDGPSIKPGTTDARLPLIRERLRSTNDLTSGAPADPELYDDSLTPGVKRFQQRHGVTADGVIGATTLTWLNEPVEERIETIRVNLERCRWLPQNLGQNYILTNIANYQLEVFEASVRALEMDVVVGKTYRKTPVFSGTMTYMVINPTWTVPPTILFNDVLPAIKKDPSYLRSHQMRVLLGDAEVNPATIDWSTLGPRNFPYVIRQDPGPSNALGAVKFMFPNPYNVYLHDTNHKDLFQLSERALSSGCIRVSQPLALADYLLRDDNSWDLKRIQSTVAGGKIQTVMLADAMPVHLLYWTAYQDDQGLVNFRKDIYERDGAVFKALQSAPPVL